MNRALATLQQNQVREWSFLSDQSFDVTFTGPDGSQWQVPAFWVGGSSWRVCFAGPVAGRYSFRCPAGQGEFDLLDRYQGDEGALAEPDRPLGRLPGGLVSGRRSDDAVPHDWAKSAAMRPARGRCR
jgi:hypothetical protein